ELIFTMLGERATTEIHQNENSRGFQKLKTDAHAGGKISGDARKALEKRLKRPVVSRRNYLKSAESKKKLD
ncbi:phage antirepressor protein, partial [bacterium]|nr:phage antirepressor protein [bacterium]